MSAGSAAPSERHMGRNAEIVRELFDAFGRRDTAAVLAVADPDIVFTPPTGRLAGRDEP